MGRRSSFSLPFLPLPVLVLPLALGLLSTAARADGARFRRGDANADGRVDLSDPVFTLTRLFLGGGELPCAKAADANDDGRVDVSDALSVLSFLYQGGGALPAPGGACGADPTPDALTCLAYSACPVGREPGQTDFAAPA